MSRLPFSACLIIFATASFAYAQQPAAVPGEAPLLQSVPALAHAPEARGSTPIARGSASEVDAVASTRARLQEPLMGEVMLFAGPFAPRGWAPCDGQLLPVQQYQALYSILGTTYGGDGRTTFALPKLNPVTGPGGRGPVKYYIALTGLYPARN